MVKSRRLNLFEKFIVLFFEVVENFSFVLQSVRFKLFQGSVNMLILSKELAIVLCIDAVLRFNHLFIYP